MKWMRVVFSCDFDEDGCCPECDKSRLGCECPYPGEDGYLFDFTTEGLFAARVADEDDGAYQLEDFHDHDAP